ncbi:putative c2h2 type zinc finger domain protein [Diplodia seriata]|uniref:Putative c2h2 type zinc finger domain protein n=1 Tax=Diplodia seriata TaxID=420778 RepID=A0A0G2EUV8_9PEZI|nr:putative c2h2 type zinc finger domain protein [Diplodia seriata]
MEDGQKRLYSKFSNIIASSIASGAANESLNKAVLRALMELENEIFPELSLRRIGENFQSRFWCGFCERVLPLKEPGSKAWDERYNHIDAHFKTRSINEWLDVEIKKRKGILKKEMEMDRRDFTDREGDWQDNMESEGGALRRSTEADVLVLAVPKGKNNGDMSGGGSMAVAGRKRSHEEMEVASGGGDDDSRARVRNRAGAHGDEAIHRSRSKSKKGETLFYCCRCRQGPYAWSLYQSCLDCEHEFCTTCDRRKHESEAEENIDYSLRNHVKNASSSQD